MKNLFFIAVILALGIGQSFAQSASPVAAAAATVATPAVPVVNPNAPKANWDKIVSDFGEIEQGIPKEAEFKLTNDGKEPLLIQTARAGCGCTNLKYSQEPVLPGKSTIVAATYNAASMGQFNKSITVTTNADAAPVMLLIKGTVIAKK
ncbi:MAG: DUF1573 domain-containing protein [Bacteroidota bacterium]|nr:DUF1573 domain-containing protein [Bacteroidota bacterium]